MMLIAGNRETAKTGAQKSANGREQANQPTEGKIKGREVRPGWGTVGALFSQAFSSSRRDVNHNCAARTRGNSAIPSTKITPRGTSGHDQRG